MWVPARRLDPEWMDRLDNPPEAVAGALHDIGLVNRALGGRRALLRAMDPFLEAQPRHFPLEVLDVGTGGGDLPMEMVLLGKRRGKRVRVTAVDRDPAAGRVAACTVAAHPEIRVVRADANRLPFKKGSFDLVTASMFLHHFDHRGVVRLLSTFRRLARRAVLVNDLRRHLLPWAFIGLTARATLRYPMFIHDAPLSVLRGFTDEELLRAARESGVERPQVERRWPFRLVMTLPGHQGGASPEAFASGTLP